MTKQNEVITVKQLGQLASDTGDVMEIVGLVNDLINFMPNVKESKVQKDPLYFYGVTQESLENVFQINQGLYKKLDDIACKLYEMVEELEDEH